VVNVPRLYSENVVNVPRFHSQGSTPNHVHLLTVPTTADGLAEALKRTTAAMRATEVLL
jgi:hypothetical protein